MDIQLTCPNCQAPITSPQEQCPKCAAFFSPEVSSRLKLYFELQDEHARLKSIQEGLHAEVNRMGQRLERYHASITKELAKSTVPFPDMEQEVKPSPAKPAATQPAKVAIPKPSPAKPDMDLEQRLGQRWMLIIGIITMVFGVGYFLKFSFDQGWVGPAGRVALAYLWGIAFLVAGDYFRKRDFGVFGLFITGGGIATLYFAAFAGFQIYHLMGQGLSFGIMLIITIFAVAISVYYKEKWLAVLAQVGGFLTPIMLSSGTDNYVFLFTYLTILNIGILAVAKYERWKLLNSLGFFFTFLIYAQWFDRYYMPDRFWPAFMYLNVFFMVYCVAPFAYYLSRLEDSVEDEEATDKAAGQPWLTVMNSFICFGFSAHMVELKFGLEWAAFVSVFYAAVFLFMASRLRNMGHEEETPFVLVVANSALFLAVTVPVLFSGHWITVFWFVQALVLLWAGSRLDRKPLLILAWVLAAISIGKFIFVDYREIFSLGLNLSFRPEYTHKIMERAIWTLSALASLFAMGAISKHYHDENGSGLFMRDYVWLFSVFAVFLLIVLNIEVSAFSYEYFRRGQFAAVSVLWTGFSLGLIYLGFRLNSAAVRKVAIGLFAATLLKVFFIDISKLYTPYRILSFIVLGVVLIGASYLYHKYSQRLIEALSTDEK